MYVFQLAFPAAEFIPLWILRRIAPRKYVVRIPARKKEENVIVYARPGIRGRTIFAIAQAQSIVHSASMRVYKPNTGAAPLTVVPARIQRRSRSAPFLRLAELRKLRKCEQVAAVCYRIRGGEIEFLLVQTRGCGRWTFPKGGTERGLTHAQAAALEAFEEAGVHGRIEEVPFLNYVRSDRRQKRKPGVREDRKEFAINAHLCEVLRLGPPKESNRKRTWFSAAEARLRLGEGRSKYDANEFARVIDAAGARIERLRRAGGVAARELAKDRLKKDRLEKDRLEENRLEENRTQNSAAWAPSQKDALQKVQFEIPADACGRTQYAPAMPYSRQPVDEIRQFSVPAYNLRRKTVPCEIVEFDPARKSTPHSRPNRGMNTKALGTSLKNG
jgi:8-oxo-dGTP pyrophosphatase MutT (NUDIX family)